MLLLLSRIIRKNRKNLLGKRGGIFHVTNDFVCIACWISGCYALPEIERIKRVCIDTKTNLEKEDIVNLVIVIVV